MKNLTKLGNKNTFINKYMGLKFMLNFYFGIFNLSVRILKNHINSISKMDHHLIFITNFSSTSNTLTFLF